MDLRGMALRSAARSLLGIAQSGGRGSSAASSSIWSSVMGATYSATGEGSNEVRYRSFFDSLVNNILYHIAASHLATRGLPTSI